MSWFIKKLKQDSTKDQEAQSEGKRKLFDMPNCEEWGNPTLLRDVEIIDRGNLRPVSLGENGLHCKELGIEIGHCKTECICRNKWEEEHPQGNREFKTWWFASGTKGQCPPLLGCHYFDAHEFEFTCLRDDVTLAPMLNEWQQAIGNPHKWNTCFVKVKKYILEKFDLLYRTEELKLQQQLDPRLICNHTMPKEVVYKYFNKHVRLVCLYLLTSYCHYPEEWEGIISKSLADLPEYKSEVDTLAVLDTVKKSFLPKIKTHKERTQKQKPLISAKEKEQEEWDEDYYTHMMSGEWE